MNMGMMMGMGMMTGGQMGMPPPGIPIPPHMAVPPIVGGSDGKKKEKSRRRKKDEEDDGDEPEKDVDDSDVDDRHVRDSRSESRSSGRRRRRGRDRDRDRDHRGGRRGNLRARSRGRGRDRSPERIEEVEKFIDENRINEEAATKIRALSPGSQRRVIARPLTGDVQNPSKVMIARVRELQAQNEKAKSGPPTQDAWATWGGVMMGATPEAINKYIEENDLDDSATRQLRALPPYHQATAIRWDLSKYKNRSAKFMSMATELSKTQPPRMQIPSMYGLPPPGMGLPPMYGLPPPGMVPSMYGMPPPMSMGAPPMYGIAPHSQR